MNDPALQYAIEELRKRYPDDGEDMILMLAKESVTGAGLQLKYNLDKLAYILVGWFFKIKPKWQLVIIITLVLLVIIPLILTWFDILPMYDNYGNIINGYVEVIK